MQPQCKTCDAYGNECRYEKIPAMSQILAMASKLQEAEETINSLKEKLEAQSPSNSGRDTVATSLSLRRPLSPKDVCSDLSIDEKGQVSFLVSIT
jgi:hypothetical protein